MTLSTPRFTRRMFLGGAGATVAVTAANAATSSLLTLRPLEVAVLLDGDDAIGSLRQVLGASQFEARVIVAEAGALRGQVRKLIDRPMPIGPISTFKASRRNPIQSVEALVIFGSWKNSLDQLPWLFRQSLPVYVDDPTLALRLSTRIPARSIPKRSLVGLNAPLDPTCQFARERIQAGATGALTDLAIIGRRAGPIFALEAAAVLDQVVGSQKLRSVRWVISRSNQSCLDVRCASGHFRIPIFHNQEREGLLPIRLAHFAAVARNEVESAISIPDIARLSQWV
jgi:hypothetical protein